MFKQRKEAGEGGREGREREEERKGEQKGEKEGGKKKRKEISTLLSFVKSLEGQEPQEATALLDLLWNKDKYNPINKKVSMFGI